MNETVIQEEIRSQAQTAASTGRLLLGRLPELGGRVAGCPNLRFIGCGSSHHAGLMAAQAFQGAAGRGVATSIVASDLITYPQGYLRSLGPKDLLVLSSRTGRTTETLLALELARRNGLATLAVTPFADSELAQKASASLVLTEAQEKSITATRSVTSTTLALLSLMHLAQGDAQFLEGFLQTQDRFFRRFDAYCDQVSSIVNQQELDKFIFLGSGAFYGLAREAELKVKEMSRTDTEANQPLEFRHGHKSTLDPHCLVVVFLSAEGLEYERGCLPQLRQFGARLLAIGGPRETEKLDGLADFLITADPAMPATSQLVLYQIFGQLAGFYQARKKGLDPSSPEGHEYCVTF